MMLFIVVTALFAVILLLPFVQAHATFEPSDGLSLTVKTDNVRDPRYFPKAFTAMMERALRDYDGSGEIRLSKPEKLIVPPVPEGELDSIVYSPGEFRPKEGCSFSKEIFCRGDAYLPGGTNLRAVACGGRLILGPGCDVGRWVDGESEIAIMPGCDLGISATSVHLMSIAADCRFRRLFAAKVCVGGDRPALNPPEPVPSTEVHRELEQAEDDARIEGSVICPRDFVIGERAVINGSVKSRRCIHVKRGAIIEGNLIADGDIFIENEVFVGGIVFSQEGVIVGPDSQIGRPGRIKSVVAREAMGLTEGALICGYVSAEHGGKTLTLDEYTSELGNRF